jgi:alpha/beta superfamily hydrolase
VRPHDLELGAETPWAAVVLLHPHPDMGGDRHNNVVDALHHALPPAGVTSLRFDFSSSDVPTAVAETLEAIEAVQHSPRFVVGYSFGGGIAASIDDARLDGWCLVAPALSLVEPTIGHDPRPKLVIAAEHDQFFGPDRLDSITKSWPAVERDVVPGSDHFFGGRTGAVATAVLGWLSSVAR